MFILLGVALAAGFVAFTVIISAGRKTRGVDLGAVSNQWLSEQREYQDGIRSR